MAVKAKNGIWEATLPKLGSLSSHHSCEGPEWQMFFGPSEKRRRKTTT
jgi:hypothetical protein